MHIDILIKNIEIINEDTFFYIIKCTFSAFCYFRKNLKRYQRRKGRHEHYRFYDLTTSFSSATMWSYYGFKFIINSSSLWQKSSVPERNSNKQIIINEKQGGANKIVNCINKSVKNLNAWVMSNKDDGSIFKNCKYCDIHKYICAISSISHRLHMWNIMQQFDMLLK